MILPKGYTEITGKYATAEVHAEMIEEEDYNQIRTICDMPFTKGCLVRIMPDTHAGKGCVIGFSSSYIDKIVPNLVGGDIGCGMLVYYLENDEIDFKKLDDLLHEGVIVPSGTNRRMKPHSYADFCNLSELFCRDYIDEDGAKLSLGTLGGGNHFVEVDKDEYGQLVLVIHSGSRHLGQEVCRCYQRLAVRNMHNNCNEKRELINYLKREGREKEIQKELEWLNKSKVKVPDEYAWLEGESMKAYLHDMDIVQNYADLNRHAIADSICEELGLKMISEFTSVHNYVDTEHGIIRKGAISAERDELVIIPLNMRDGSLICLGKGNYNWNRSAPHGAGRIMSRTKAKQLLTMNEFRESMEGIYTSCVDISTIDESPMAYKPADSVIRCIEPTVEIISTIKPVYNFKASN